MSDNVTRIHPAPSIPNPLAVNPWAEMSDAEISDAIVQAHARIDAVEHTKRSLLREIERRNPAPEAPHVPAGVIDINTARASTNLACPACGCEWLNLPVNVDARTRNVTGWAMRATCHECDAEVPLYGTAT